MDDWYEYVEEYSHRYYIEPSFIYAIIYAESAGKPNAKSYMGARGLMQLMPLTANMVGVKNIYDPEENIAGGCKYIVKLNNYSNITNDVQLLWAWNAGLKLYYMGIMPKETREFISKVLTVKEVIDNNGQQGT